MWGFRASDIYQGGETEPLMLTETVLAADKSLDTEFAKSYFKVNGVDLKRLSRRRVSPRHANATNVAISVSERRTYVP